MSRTSREHGFKAPLTKSQRPSLVNVPRMAQLTGETYHDIYRLIERLPHVEVETSDGGRSFVFRRADRAVVRRVIRSLRRRSRPVPPPAPEAQP